MSNPNKLILANPYENDEIPFLSQEDEEHSFLFEDQVHNQLQTQLQFNPSEEYSFSNVPYTENYQTPQLFQGYSQTNARPLSVLAVQLSGVHQKYLSEDGRPLPKKILKTETKLLKPKKTAANIKFSQSKSKKVAPPNLNIDPLSEGFSSLQIDSQALFQSLVGKREMNQEEKTALFSQMGLKQPKTLGKGRSKRDFEAILNFLSKGQLPNQFVNDFVKLLTTCILCNHRNINMNQSSKISLKGTSLKYPVLKPNYKILSYIRSLKTPRCGSAYELALNQDFGLRKYQLQIESLEHALRQAQWRYDCSDSVLKCLYVELLSPGGSRSLKIDLYIQHMEMNLYDFSHLLLQEAMYLIVESIKGYRALHERYGKATVASECIGICSSGTFAVWMNRFHEKDTPEARGKTTPLQIIQQLLKIVKERCEPICQKFLGKIQSYICKNKPSWSQILDFLKRFILKNQIKVPGNLKYLLHQHRIKQNVTSIRTSLNEEFQPSEEFGGISIVVKSPRFQQFVPSQIRSRKNSNNLEVTTPKITAKLRKYSAAQPSLTNVHRIEGLGDKTNSSICLTPKISSRKYSCRDFDDKNDVVKTLRKLQVTRQQSVHCQKVKHLRTKSQSTDNLITVNLLHPCDESSPKSPIKQTSGLTRTEHSRTKSKQYEDKENISFQAETLKKIRNRQSIKLDSLPFRQVEYEESNPFEELQGFEAPVVLSPQQSLQPTFKCIPEPHQTHQSQGENMIKQGIYSMNNWTKTFKDLMTTSGDVNVSITDGKEISTYLSDVKLTHLDRLSHHMVESLIHEGTDRSIPEPNLKQQ